MNWLNSNLDTDGTDSSASDALESNGDLESTVHLSGDIGNDGKSYQCAICEKSTDMPLYNKEQSCLQCPSCNRSWCLQSPAERKKCAKLDLIPKRYLELKFSKMDRRRHNHRQTRHTLSWIGTNILGNLGNVEDTLHQLNLARNVEEPNLESLRAQQRFGMNHPNSKSYHATHPVIIDSLPTLNLDNVDHQKLLHRHKSCPICQLDFIDNGDDNDNVSDIDNEIDELDQLLMLSDDEELDQIIKHQNQDIFQKMNHSRTRNTKYNTMEPKESISYSNQQLQSDNYPKVVTFYEQNTDDESKKCSVAESFHSSFKHKEVAEDQNTSVIAEWNQNNEHTVHAVNDQEAHIGLELNSNVVIRDEKDDEKCADDVNNKEEEECVKDGIVRLWCGHIFHNECVVPWLSKQNTCPLCRFELPSNNPDYELQKRMETYDGHFYHVRT